MRSKSSTQNRPRVLDRRRWLGVLCAVGMAAVSIGSSGSTASAQQLDPEEYAAAVDQATQVYNSGNLTKALRLYLEVKSRASGPDVDYSLARTYHKLHHCPKAQVFYLSVMENYDLPDDHPLFQRSSKYYSELIQCENWGTVELTCQGGELAVDDETIGTCVSGTYKLPAGAHTFSLSAEGAEAVSESVDLSDGQSINLSLEPPAKVIKETVEVPIEQPSAAPVASTDGGGPNWLAIGLIGGGGLVLGSAAFFNAAGYDALVDVQKAADRGDTAGRKTAEDDVELYKILTGVTVGIGGAALAAGVTLLILDWVDESETESVSFGASPNAEGGGSITLQGRF